MFMVIQTWQVLLRSYEGMPILRVPENDLDHVLRVLTFNRIEFDVRREDNPLDVKQEASSG